MEEKNEATTTEPTKAKAPAKRTSRKVPTPTTPEAKLAAYNALTDVKKAAMWRLGRDAGESVKTIRLNRTGHGPSAALREWHRLTDLGLLKDPIGKRGRPANGATKATTKSAAPAKKATARKAPTKKATPAKATATKKALAATTKAAAAGKVLSETARKRSASAAADKATS